MSLVPRLFALMTAAFLAACASPAPDKVADASPGAREVCEPTLGSRICRKPGTGNINSVTAISGDDLRRSGGPIMGPTPGRIGN